MKGNLILNWRLKTRNQRLHFLRMLKILCVEKQILTLLYQSTVESNICSSATVCYSPKLTRNDKNILIRVVKKAKTFGVEAKSLDVLYQEGVMKQVVKIMNNVSHPLHHCYVYLRSVPAQSTNIENLLSQSILLFKRLKLNDYDIL